MRQYETYKCNKCGCEVEVQETGTGAKLSCCGEEMEMITENLTAVNLMKAFAGESQARNKYEFFAEVAFNEGLHRIARFFQEAADNEKYHAMAEFKAYNKLVHDVELDSTAKNIQYAADGEKYEHEEMYPNFEAIAKSEGLKEIARMFKAIGKVEVEHEKEYLELKQALIDEGFLESEDEEEWVCEVCGHVHRGKKPPKECPLCRVEKEYFKKRNKDVTVG
jgi:desulfoferrodoxin-like iron-binding protein